MTVTYELRALTDGLSPAETLETLLRALDRSKEIHLDSMTKEGNLLRAIFEFRKWNELAKEKYLDTKRFESAIPVDTMEITEIEGSVRISLFEAAESELLASTLKVTIDADPQGIFFRSEYPETMTKRQAKQVGIYLQQILEFLFGFLKEDGNFPPIQILDAER